MSSIRTVLMAACLALPNLLFSQTIPISDNSPGESPILLTGTVTFGDSDTVDCSIIGHNRSLKPIMTLAVQLKLTKPSGEPGEFKFERDHFFKELTVSPPNSDFLVTSDCQMGRELGIPRLPAPPQANAKLLFVQYEDGSVWGDDKIRVELMTQRAAVIDFLNWLKTAYSTGGRDGLTEALSKDQKPGTMVSSKLAGLRMIRDSQGVGAVADAINKNLATAELRKAALLP